MALNLATSPLYGGLFGDPILADILGEDRELAEMIRIEAALARVQGDLGIIDHGAALGDALDELANQAAITPVDLARGTAGAGVPVPALVEALRSHVPEALGRWLHWGATSQDILDTAHVLQYCTALDDISARLTALIDALEGQSAAHSATVMAGRTRSQLATPITFGVRIAHWAQPLIACEAAYPAVRAGVAKVQFGGAVGINSAIHPHGVAVADALAAALGLAPAPPWHTDRSSLLALGAWLASVAAALSKMAGDLTLMGRQEIREARAGTGGGSSTMPQKSNPVLAEAIVTLSTLAQVAQAGLGLGGTGSPREERDGAVWALEWALLPQSLMAVGTALRHALALAESLEANTEAMSARLDTEPGLMAEAASLALARYLPRGEAKRLVQEALAAPEPFAEALAARAPHGLELGPALDPTATIAPAASVRHNIFAARRR